VRFEGEQEDRYCSTGGVSGHCFELCKVLPSAEQTSEGRLSAGHSMAEAVALHDSFASVASTMHRDDSGSAARARQADGGWEVGAASVFSSLSPSPASSPPPLPPRVQPASNAEGVDVPLVQSKAVQSPGKQSPRVIHINRRNTSLPAEHQNEPHETHEDRYSYVPSLFDSIRLKRLVNQRTQSECVLLS
jgi:hypothetical protein